MSVVLPEPEKPISATNSPSSMDRLMSVSTSRAAVTLRDIAQLEMAHRVGLVRERALQRQHHAIEQEADDADGEHRHHDPAQRFGAAVLEFVPDEFSETRVLRQHFGGDQHHPAHPERQAHAGEDVGQRRRQHQLGELRGLLEAQHPRHVEQVPVDRRHAHRRVDDRRPQRTQRHRDRRVDERLVEHRIGASRTPRSRSS